MAEFASGRIARLLAIVILLYLVGGFLGAFSMVVRYVFYDQFNSGDIARFGSLLIGLSIVAGLSFTAALCVWFWFARRFIMAGEARGLGHAKAVGYVIAILGVLGLLSSVPTMFGLVDSGTSGPLLVVSEYASLFVTAVTILVGIQLIQAV
ncbi:MAG TPA: hypothetical protein VGB18_03560, partial [Candidatus Thermoplasmatota archaeon]